MIFDPLPLLLRAQTSSRVQVAEEAKAWAEVFAKARRALREAGLDEQSIQVSQSANNALKEMTEAGLYRNTFLARHLYRSKESILEYVIGLLREELDRRNELVKERQGEFEQETEQRSNLVENALQYKRSVAETVAKERMALDDKEGAVQQGCACGLLMGCLFLGAYLGFSFLMMMLGRQTRDDSPTAVIFLSMVVTPLAVAVIMQLLVGMKRWMVEADLTTKVRNAEQLCDKAIEQAESRYRSQEPGLKQKLEESLAQVKIIEDALATLGYKVVQMSGPAEETTER